MDNELQGALFKNDRKMEEKHPDYKGMVTVAGQQYDIGAWLRKSKNGATYMSMRLSIPRDSKHAPKQSAPKDGRDMSDADDDLPF